MRKVILSNSLMFCLLASGCASIPAIQRPITAKDLGKSVCPSQQEREKAATLTGADRATYRDGIISECVKAIDHHYQTFKLQLHQESATTKLTTAILSTGAAAIGAFAKADIASRLAAGNAFLLGTSAAIDKDIFFDQTLPALEASMDAKKDTILTRIIDAQRSDPHGDRYSLVSAGYDLNAYQNAGNLYVAVAELTKTAVVSAKAASDERARAEVRLVDMGEFHATDASLTGRYMALLAKVDAYKDPQDAGKLDDIINQLKIEVPADASFTEKRQLLRVDLYNKSHVADPADQATYASMLEGII